MDLPRTDYLNRMEMALRRSPIVALLGPRQCGKTTLARQFSSHRPTLFFDLESPSDWQRLQNPEMMLGRQHGLVVLDEIQRMPELLPVLRVLADRPERPAQFLILGSVSPELVKGASETLAGRVEFIQVGGLGLGETQGEISPECLWLRGGFPRSCLAVSDADSAAWRESFIQTFLERDLPQLGIRIPAIAMRRFWTMIAHYHGQVWNGSELGRSLGLSDKTLRGYLDILTESFMVRQLQPWHENLSKRQVKSPKLFFRDSGILHSLLSIQNEHDLHGHPRLGASWEGFALEETLRCFRYPDAYFWGTYSGAELDLLLAFNGKRHGFEFKCAEAPKSTKSMHVAVADLGLEHLWIVHPGKHAYPLAERISAIPLAEVKGLQS